MSFLAFCASNVLIDFESLYNLIHRRSQVHAFFHTYIGATLAALGVVCVFAVLRWVSAKIQIPDPLRWKELTYRQVIIGAALGAYSHVALDSVMHRDITPLVPLTADNTLLGLVSLGVLHWSCVVAGVLGALGVGVRSLLASARGAA